MIKNLYSNLTILEYWDGIQKAFNNSKRLLRASKILIFFKLYGPSNSLAVLSAEEALKSFAFIWLMIGIWPSDLSMEKVLQNHIKKHEIGWWMGFMQDVFDICDMGHNFDIKKLSSEEKSKMARRFYEANVNAIEKRTKYPQKNWWENANKRKKDGLYVDFEKGVWKTPGNVKKSEVVKSHKEVSKILMFLKKHIERFDRFNVEGKLGECVLQDREWVKSNIKVLTNRK